MPKNVAVTWWLFSAAAFAGALCLALHAASLARRALRPDGGEERRAVAIGAALFALALLVRVLVPEWVPYTFNDEYDYLRSATVLRDTGVYALSGQPPALIYLYAVAFLVFGASPTVAFATTAVLGSATVPALYGCLRAMAVRRDVSLVAAVLLLLHPLHVKHSGSASLEVASLLFLVLAIATFARWLRAPSSLALLGFATSVFAALTVRVENFALVPLFAAAFLLARRRGGAARVATLPARDGVVLACTVAVAALYLPDALQFHHGQQGWWQSELSPPALLANNLAFWIGGSVATGKIALLLLLGGVAAAWRWSRAACIAWLAFLLLFSAVYVVHGANLGYHAESLHPRYFASRSGGHDMFRFDVPLLSGVLFFLATGIVAAGRIVAPLAARLGAPLASAIAAASVALLLLVGREYAAWDPIAFLRSPYNRPVEIAQYRFLARHLAERNESLRCYILSSPLAPFFGDAVEIVVPESARDIRLNGKPSYLVASTFDLARPRKRRLFDEIGSAFAVTEVAREPVAKGELRLFRVEPRG